MSLSIFISGEPPSEDFVDTPGKSASTNLFLYQASNIC